MNIETFSNIGRIIQRDSKTTTYKFALLRATIEIIQDNTPYVKFSEDRVSFPIGSLILKWLIYYYPIFESVTKIPQISDNANLAFGNQFNQIISYYERHGGFSAFYNDINNKKIPQKMEVEFTALIRKMRETITTMPMKYIGRSLQAVDYSIYKIELSSTMRRKLTINCEDVINNCGCFSIPRDYYEVFRMLGSFIGGQDSILFEWARFSVKASGKKLAFEQVIQEMLKSPITQREIEESKKIYRNVLSKDGSVFCVWTGNRVSNYDIDHLIPFSVWKNNDLWNLLPSQASINNKKRDKIPSVKMIEKSKSHIKHYWELLQGYQKERFEREMRVALLGDWPQSDWQHAAIEQLKKNCEYLIVSRGYEEWDI